MTAGKQLSKGDLWEEYSTNLHGAYNAMRRAFKRSGLSQDDIAHKLGTDKGLMSKRLNGSKNLTLKTLSFIASALGCRLTIDFTPYEEIGAVEHNESTQASAWLLPLPKNSNTADEPAYVKPLRKAA